jgi:hypothetical protein
MMVVPAMKRLKESRWSRKWARWPWALARGVVVGWRTRIAWRTVKMPRDWRRGCGETSGRVGWVKTEDQMMARRRTAPSWESQAVPGGCQICFMIS